MPKQLGEFLQEQQEPFTLELYLLERGYFRSNSLNSNADLRCFSVNSTKFLKRSASCGSKKKRKVIPSCSKLVKVVLSKFGHSQIIKKFANSTTNVDIDNFSSDTSPQTVTGLCHEDRKFDLDFLEVSNKQLSPVSVLEETKSSDDDFPDHKKQECFRAEKQEQNSSRSEETSCESQYIINKKAIQQSRQLFFDCVKEVVENERMKKSKEEEFQRILGAEELWELLLENIWLWSKDSMNETNFNHLIHFDPLNYFEESRGVEQIREIGRVIDDLIFADISSEIVLDMLKYSSSRYT